MTPPITHIRETRPDSKLDATVWKRIEGTDPRTVNIVNCQSPGGRKIMGTWICKPGKWEMDYDRWEYCHVQEGYSIIPPEGKEPVHVRAGRHLHPRAGYQRHLGSGGNRAQVFCLCLLKRRSRSHNRNAVENCLRLDVRK
ncbi:putative cupin superfamily protein [Roseateles toxinivorans]|uniref:Putative cupin superfamily protein n=1 Tax=Roseateles toxinivorans TaxID=270368 RepID=A0A4R6QHY5_9BURK|nr:putative cupin superfamily protein [Roseateles toxinivorans]